MKVLILAGGLGTRLGKLTENIPKPLIEVNGKPFLESLLHYYKKQGFTDFILAIGHHSEKIEKYFGNGSKWDVNIKYSKEETPLGTGGAIKLAEDLIDDDVLVCNGDSFLDIDFKKLIEQHKEKNADFTMALVEAPNHKDNELTLLDENDKIIKILKRETEENNKYRLKNKAYINSGVYLINKKVLDLIPEGKVSLEHDIFPLIIEKVNSYGKKFDNVPFIDIGTPDRYEKSHEVLRESLE